MKEQTKDTGLQNEAKQERGAGLSRRGFLGLGALAAAGSVMGLAGCAPQTPAAANADARRPWRGKRG